MKLPRIGEIITITKRSGRMWDSGFNGRCPNDSPEPIYPLTGVVENASDRDGGMFNLGGWGFALSNVEWEYTVPIYEIF